MMREKALLLGVYFLVLIVSRTELLANEKFEVADDTLIYSGDYSVDEDDDAEIDGRRDVRTAGRKSDLGYAHVGVSDLLVACRHTIASPIYPVQRVMRLR